MLTRLDEVLAAAAGWEPFPGPADGGSMFAAAVMLLSTVAITALVGRDPSRRAGRRGGRR